MENSDIYLNETYKDWWVFYNGNFIKINDGTFVDIEDIDESCFKTKIGHIDLASYIN